MTKITPCSERINWIDLSLMKTAQYDSTDDSFLETEDKNTPDSQISSDNLKNPFYQLVEPSYWGNGEQRYLTLPQKTRSQINKGIALITNSYLKDIPLKEIFDLLELNNIIPIQEDGTKWSGFLMGSAECGSEKAKNQRASIQLVMKNPDGKWAMLNSNLILHWCTMNNSGKYEIVCYLS